jgi:hypothetical protein
LDITKKNLTFSITALKKFIFKNDVRKICELILKPDDEKFQTAENSSLALKRGWLLLTFKDFEGLNARALPICWRRRP